MNDLPPVTYKPIGVVYSEHLAVESTQEKAGLCDRVGGES